MPSVSNPVIETLVLHRRYIPAVLTLYVGLVLSALMFVMVWHWEDKHLQNELSDHTDNLATVLHRSIDGSLEVLQATGNFYYLYDKTVASDRTGSMPEKHLLTVYEADTQTVIAEPRDEEYIRVSATSGYPYQTACSRILNIADREWLLVVLPTPEYVATQNHWQAWTALVIGLLWTGIPVSYLLVSLECTAQIEQVVRERTAELSKLNAELTSLNKMNYLLQACLTVEEAYTVIAQSVPPLFSDGSGGVFASAADRILLESIATWGTALTTQKLFTPDECLALRRGRTCLVEDTGCGLFCKHLPASLPAEYLCVPMMAQGEALGVLYLSYAKRGQLTPAKQRLAAKVAEQSALALANLKMRETLQSQSIRDPLTDLFNRRYLETTLEREVCRTEREQQPLGIIMLDIDYFKRFNDTFGHTAGDTLLRELGKFLKGHIRAGDIACRYGGEEFMLILPAASLDVIQQRAEQLRKAVKCLKVQHYHQSLGSITLSLGVAVFPSHGLTAQEVIRAADAALYQAKAEGRDRVVTAR